MPFGYQPAWPRRRRPPSGHSHLCAVNEASLMPQLNINMAADRRRVGDGSPFTLSHSAYRLARHVGRSPCRGRMVGRLPVRRYHGVAAQSPYRRGQYRRRTPGDSAAHVEVITAQPAMPRFAVNTGSATGKKAAYSHL